MTPNMTGIPPLKQQAVPSGVHNPLPHQASYSTLVASVGPPVAWWGEPPAPVPTSEASLALRLLQAGTRNLFVGCKGSITAGRRVCPARTRGTAGGRTPYPEGSRARPLAFQTTGRRPFRAIGVNRFPAGSPSRRPVSSFSVADVPRASPGICQSAPSEDCWTKCLSDRRMPLPETRTRHGGICWSIATSIPRSFEISPLLLRSRRVMINRAGPRRGTGSRNFSHRWESSLSCC